MIGRRLSGRYEIISRLGDGGMAIVYKAQDLILERLVAVKVLRSEFSNDEDFIRRFRREAESVSSLSHPNIVSIYDIGEEEDCYFIVMEYVDGETLKDFIKEHSPVAISEAVYILKQMASALEHAHEYGIVHRDIKPHNILIDEQGIVKVTDFGIAVAMNSATITFTNSIMGSAHYLSPEQAKGSKATIKSDIYALGIVMYELLTGQLPFPGTSPVTVALKHLNEPLPLPSKYRSDIPQSIENIVIKATAKDPKFRYENMSEFYQDLETALDPNRQNEPRLILEEDYENDEEKTKIIPAIKDNQDESHKNINKDPPQTDQGKTRKKKTKKILWITIIVFLLLIGAGILSITVMPNIFYVKDTTVPDVKGKTYQQAMDEFKKRHLYIDRKDIPDDKIKKNHVIKVNPKENSVVKEGSTVTLYISEGPRKIHVGDYVGYEKDTVKQLLKGRKYKDIIWKKEASDTVSKGEVMKQNPSPGSEVVGPDTVLELTYSTGPPQVTVPDLHGMSKADAEAALNNSQLRPDFKDGDYSDSVSKDHVLKQQPANGESAGKNSTVTVYLSKGEKLEPQKITKKIKVTVDEPAQADPDDKDKNHSKDDDHHKKQSDDEKDDKSVQPVHVQIYYSDAEHDHDVFVDETIKKSKTYKLPLTIKPHESAHYKVLVDGKAEKEETVDYDEAKK
ncbi:serine/threonine-protein kinase [Scopulibacillus daqui]|uniref:non-specific serine/threonine protein kinase n=1 Tax=Scopulibacillus daqui TaxID=1469162 RepID=A0ABS2PW81_9BACL|nr:Stk1 family PASTA domain-containing Ser/Thr kinase [Scopulibacillus daqui]MBM7644311.1 serine/threonine-protein kinase [Scopulibacillus daqui]